MFGLGEKVKKKKIVESDTNILKFKRFYLLII